VSASLIGTALISDDRMNRAYGSCSLVKLKQEIDKVDWGDLISSSVCTQRW